MKDFDDIFKERLEDFEMKLPATDRNLFLKRKAAREHAAKRRRSYLSLAVGIPAAAAIIITLFMTTYILTTYEPAFIDEFVVAEEDLENGVVYTADLMPEYPGGPVAMQAYLAKEMVYPEWAVKDSIQGRVLVSFVVEKDGSLTDPKVLKKVHPLLDEEALRVVSGMSGWNPGMLNGDTCRVRMTIPVNFRLY